MSEKPHSSRRQDLWMRRLETLVDSVFALVIVVLVLDLPRPSDFDGTVTEFVGLMLDSLDGVVIGMVMVVIYWVQSNLLFGGLAKTDGRHATISLFQIFFLLFYLYAVSLGTHFNDDPIALALQSIGAAAVGFCAWAAWMYAAKDRRLLHDDMTDLEVKDISIRTLAEPAAALVTLGFAFVGPGAWNLAWLTYIPLAKLLRWRQGRRETGSPPKVA